MAVQSKEQLCLCLNSLWYLAPRSLALEVCKSPILLLLQLPQLASRSDSITMQLPIDQLDVNSCAGEIEEYRGSPSGKMPTKICPKKLLRAPSSRSSVVLLLSHLHSSVSQDPAGGLSSRDQRRAALQSPSAAMYFSCKDKRPSVILVPSPTIISEIVLSLASTTLHCRKRCSWKSGQLFHLYGRCARKLKNWTKLWSNLPFSYTSARTGENNPSKYVQFLYIVQVPPNLRSKNPVFLALAVTFELIANSKILNATMATS